MESTSSDDIEFRSWSHGTDTDSTSRSIDPVTDIELIRCSGRLDLGIVSDGDIVGTARDTRTS